MASGLLIEWLLWACVSLWELFLLVAFSGSVTFG